MKRNFLLVLAAMLIFTIIPAHAQFGSLKKIVDKSKTEKKSESSDQATTAKGETPGQTPSDDAQYYYVGQDKMAETKISELKVCADTFRPKLNWKKGFKQWFDDISPTAQLKMFEMGRCELMGFHIVDKPGRGYRKVDDLKERAEGLSVYQVEDGELVLIKDFIAPGLYIVVVPQVAKAGLKLADLNLCVTPDQKDKYRRKTRSASNCHDLKQSLFVFEKYKKYPGEYQTNSALFFEKDFNTLNKQGKFKGLKIYKLVGGNLEPME